MCINFNYYLLCIFACIYPYCCVFFITASTKQCTRCGKKQHTRNKCPARDATCHKCGKKGHYSTKCRSKTVDDSNLETAFLDAATAAAEENAWYADILVGKYRGEKVTFKLDTGAEVTAVSQDTYRMLPEAPPLSTPQKVLCGPSRKPLQLCKW